MIKFGTISEVDATKGLARVKFDADDNMVSYWLPISHPKTLQDKFIVPFDINEHVWCLMDQNMEYGIIGGAIYDSGNQPDGGDNKKIAVKFAGSLLVEFDRNTKTLSIDGPGDFSIDINGTGKGKVNIKCNEAVIESLTSVEVKAATEILLTVPLVIASGALQAASLAITGGGAITGAGSLSVSGTISGGTVQQGTVVLGTHIHSGVTAGGANSGPPV